MKLLEWRAARTGFPPGLSAPHSGFFIALKHATPYARPTQQPPAERDAAPVAQKSGSPAPPKPDKPHMSNNRQLPMYLKLLEYVVK
jgi:hypothetical protein